MTCKFPPYRPGAAVMLALLLTAPAGRAAVSDEPAPDPHPEPTVLAAAAAPVALTALQAEISGLRAQEVAAVAELAAQISQENDPARRLELQRAVEAAKREGRSAVLGAQLRHARTSGDAVAIEAIEDALAALRQGTATSGVGAKPD